MKETKWMGLIPIGKETLDDVRGAQVDKRCDKDGCTYRMQLIRRQGGIVPLAIHSSDTEQLAARINAYAEDGGVETLELRLGPAWFALVTVGMGAICFLSIIKLMSKR